MICKRKLLTYKVTQPGSARIISVDVFMEISTIIVIS